MHPTLARYLSLSNAADALRGDPPASELAGLHQVGERHPELRDLVLGAKPGGENPEVQEALIFLAAHAALIDLRQDAELGPVVAETAAYLKAEGAEPEEVDGTFAALLIEEALGYEDDPEQFDQAFFAESLRTLPTMLELTEEKVSALRSGFVLASPAEEKKAAAAVSEALTEVAWSEGPELINPEHLHAALELCEERLNRKERPRGPRALRSYLQHLAELKLVGPERLRRLDAELAALEGPVGLA